MRFDDIDGYELNKDYLNKTIDNGNFLNSYLFLGNNKDVSIYFAKEFAKYILCMEGRTDKCTCPSCISFINGINPDFKLINEEDATIKIDTIREIVNDVYEKPVQSLKKVYIIYGSEKLTIEAQNCLLKTLEEPPEYVTIILITKNSSLLLDTIRSRCLSLNFNDDNSSLDDDALAKVNDLLNIIEKGDIIETFSASNFLYSKDEVVFYLDALIEALFNKGKKNYKYINCIEDVNNTINNLKSNANLDMSIDRLIFKLNERINR